MSKEKDYIIPEHTVNTDGMSHEEYMKHRGFSEVKTITIIGKFRQIKYPCLLIGRGYFRLLFNSLILHCFMNSRWK